MGNKISIEAPWRCYEVYDQLMVIAKVGKILKSQNWNITFQMLNPNVGAIKGKNSITYPTISY